MYKKQKLNDWVGNAIKISEKSKKSNDNKTIYKRAEPHNQSNASSEITISGASENTLTLSRTRNSYVSQASSKQNHVCQV